jgi:hypothetical protein
MISPYLNRPILPLADALPQMLAKIETKLADGEMAAAEKWQLRVRAGLIRSLLTPQVSPTPR